MSLHLSWQRSLSSSQTEITYFPLFWSFLVAGSLWFSRRKEEICGEAATINQKSASNNPVWKVQTVFPRPGSLNLSILASGSAGVHLARSPHQRWKVILAGISEPSNRYLVKSTTCFFSGRADGRFSPFPECQEACLRLFPSNQAVWSLAATTSCIKIKTNLDAGQTTVCFGSPRRNSDLQSHGREWMIRTHHTQRNAERTEGQWEMCIGSFRGLTVFSRIRTRCSFLWSVCSYHWCNVFIQSTFSRGPSLQVAHLVNVFQWEIKGSF